MSNVVPISRRHDPFALSDEDDDHRQDAVPDTVTRVPGVYSVDYVKVFRPYDQKVHGPRSWKPSADVPEWMHAMVNRAIGANTNPFTSMRSFMATAIGMLLNTCNEWEHDELDIEFLRNQLELDRLDYLASFEAKQKQWVDAVEDRLESFHRGYDLKSVRATLDEAREHFMSVANKDTATMREAARMLDQWEARLSNQ